MRYPILISITALLITSCATKTETGALTGAGVGAVAGGLITHSAGGAAIGAAIGTVGGAVVGHLMEEDDQKKLDKKSPGTSQKIQNGEPLNVNDVIKMHEAGLSDEKIINILDATNSTFDLSNADRRQLKKAGVSKQVVDHMEGS